MRARRISFSLNPAVVQVATPTMVSIMVGTTSVIVTPDSVSVVAGSALLTMGADPFVSTPQQLASLIRTDLVR